ncbi:MAG: hypothetical protein GY928_15570, partial [Colwellia sp.]|nr:hypothetical protein [Colwellia sp.]
ASGKGSYGQGSYDNDGYGHNGNNNGSGNKGSYGQGSYDNGGYGHNGNNNDGYSHNGNNNDGGSYNSFQYTVTPQSYDSSYSKCSCKQTMSTRVSTCVTTVEINWKYSQWLNREHLQYTGRHPLNCCVFLTGIKSGNVLPRYTTEYTRQLFVDKQVTAFANVAGITFRGVERVCVRFRKDDITGFIVPAVFQTAFQVQRVLDHRHYHFEVEGHEIFIDCLPYDWKTKEMQKIKRRLQQGGY